MLLLVLAFSLGVLGQKCKTQSGHVSFCTNGEECTLWGCRCFTDDCFHLSANKCPSRSQCGSECCRAGESCISNVGCRMERDWAPPACTGSCQEADEQALMMETMNLKIKAREDCHTSGRCKREGMTTQVGAAVPCVDGMAGIYPCDQVDLLSVISNVDLGGLVNGVSNTEGNDIWGWSARGQDFVIMGLTTGTSFVDITDPVQPIVLGFLPPPPGATASSIWRDIKVYNDHAFIVSEAFGAGMQVFDLMTLFDIANPSPDNLLTETAFYTLEMGARRSTHNIVINEETGYAYLVGCQTCRGGLLMVDILDPANPVFAGCFDSDGYTHDAECVVYNGIDHRFVGSEICFAYNENTLTIVDVTDKSNVVQLARTSYYGVRYSHQGWLTENQQYLLLDDELDEMYNTYDNSKRTVTYVWDVSDLTNPIQLYEFQAPVQAVDHNQYIRGDYSYQANYASGLRILSGMHALGNSDNVQLAAYFDVYPAADVAEFYGAWSTYPFYSSTANRDTVALSSIEGGLFLLRFERLSFEAKRANATLKLR